MEFAKNPLPRLSALLVSLAAATSAICADLYANDIDGNLYKWNRSTSVFDFSFGTSIGSMHDIAWDPTSNRMFASQTTFPPSGLFSIDLQTNTSVRVGDLIDNFGTQAPMQGLDWSSSLNTLYGYTQARNGLHLVNKLTAQTTFTQSFTGNIIFDYTFDGVNNRTIGLGIGAIYEVDVALGTHMQIATVANVRGGLQYDDVTGLIMLVSEDGNVFWLDPSANYAQTLIYNSGRTMMGMAAVPEPASFVTIAVLSAWTVKGRRKRRQTPYTP